MYSKEIRLHAQNMLTILGSKVNMIEWTLNNHLMYKDNKSLIIIPAHSNLHFVNEQGIPSNPMKYETNNYMHKFRLANHLALITSFAS